MPRRTTAAERAGLAPGMRVYLVSAKGGEPIGYVKSYTRAYAVSVAKRFSRFGRSRLTEAKGKTLDYALTLPDLDPPRVPRRYNASYETAREAKWRKYWSATPTKHAFKPGPGGQLCDVCGTRDYAPIHNVAGNPRRARSIAVRQAMKRRRNPTRPKSRAPSIQKKYNTTVNALHVEYFQGYAEDIRYLRGADGKPYSHVVETDSAELYLCEHATYGKCLLIVDPSGKTPLWG